MLVAFAETEGSDRQIWKDCDPGSLQARANAAAPISEMLGGLVGSEGSGIFGVSGKAERRDSGGDSSTSSTRAAEALVGMVQKAILLFTQSINGLCWVSQLCPRTKEQDESSCVTKSDVGKDSPEGKQRVRSTASEMMLLEEPLNKRKVIRLMEYGEQWR